MPLEALPFAKHLKPLTSMHCLRFFLAILGALALSGCFGNPVLVVDPKNAPIPGAKVEAVTPSYGFHLDPTNAKGITMLPGRWETVQKVEWISVTKGGFQPSGHVTVNRNGKTIVVLKPSK